MSALLRGVALRERLRALPARARDPFVDALLGIDAIPEDDHDLPRGAVPYLPCPVDDVLAFVAAVHFAPHDRFVDVGAGLGRVAMLVHLLTGVAAHGVEIQASLVREGERLRDALGLAAVTFECADASAITLDGSVFFLYAPFNGELRTRVLARIRAAATTRSIRVITVDMPLDLPWLSRCAFEHPSVALYASTLTRTAADP